MKIYFDTNFSPRALFLEEYKKIMASKFSPLLTKICQPSNNMTDDYENIYRLIICGAIIFSGQDSSKSLAEVQEVTSIVQTYLTLEDMQDFCSLQPNVRKEKFFHLINLVLGTRVYNFSLGFGAVGFDNLTELTGQALAATVVTIDEYLKEIRGCANISTLLYIRFMMSDCYVTPQSLEEVDELGFPPSLLRSVAINARQLIQYVCQLRDELVEIVDDHQRDERCLDEILGEVFSCLRAGNNPSSADLQKQILELARVWTRLKENLAYIAMIANVLKSLKEYSFEPFIQLGASEFLKRFLETDISSDDQQKEAITRIIPREENRSKWIFPTTSSYGQIDLNGFCAWSLVRYKGLPVPCSPKIGVFVQGGRRYGFSSVAAAKAFDLAPNKFIDGINEIVRQNPDLFLLLKMPSPFEKETRPADSLGITDQEIQTEVHPITVYIDSKYTWDEWELRRRALQLLYIRKCVTHSMQTMLSNFRRENTTQVYLPKDEGVQTKRDNYSQVPKPSVFIEGLRGGQPIDQAKGASGVFRGAPYSNWCTTIRSTEATKVDLTLPIEDHFCGEINGLKNMNRVSCTLRTGVSSSLLKIFSRSFAVKKKPNYEDQPEKIRKPVLVKTLRGFQFADGDQVYKGDILVRQLGMEFYPGENVRLNRDTWDLVALRSGRFTITTETLSPYPDSPLHSLVNEEGRVIQRPFVHVIAHQTEPVFKLKRSL
ncbi:unnamed protein product [Rodentolepis nana]|uniref:Cilia- and flagella-associated protein 206 n=1 Tax=Rodentolepis nana TaxID=102285 RepID=A0A158QHE6_RODNA|nr:unnamed protein product [Rodentolepis nana]